MLTGETGARAVPTVARRWRSARPAEFAVGILIQSGWRNAKKIATVAAWVAVALSALYLFLASMGFAPNPYVCLDDTIDDIQISDYDILLVDTSCDAIAKSDRISVSISRSGSRKGELIFEYDPMDYNRLPSFSVDGRGSLLVSIAAVATVFYEKHEWTGGNINYRVGREYYPEREKLLPKRTTPNG
jgi:hypothetical protein